MAERRFNGIKALAITGLISLLVLPILLLVLLTVGLIHGEEFSPDDFSRRYFSYNRIPWIKLTIMGMRHDDATPVLEQTLLADGWIKPTKNKPKTWHLVYDSHTPRESPDCDARLLCAYLDMTDHEGDSIWLNWNEEHPKSGKLFWTEVAELARHNLYTPIPNLMRHILEVKEDDPARIKRRMDGMLSQAYCDRASTLQHQGKHEDAIDFFSLSIQKRPTAQALQGRARSHAELGNQKDCDADLAAANELSNR